MLYPGVPIISITPGNYVKIKPTDLSNLEFSLVDFQNEPVVLKSPLNLVLECRENTTPYGVKLIEPRTPTGSGTECPKT
jgi:hypothetical protein